MKISSGCILKWLCVVGFLMCSCVQETEANSCEMIEVQTCLGAYVKGFTASTAATSDEVGLHCDLDRNLLLCTETALKKCGQTPVLLALGRAVLSYTVFDRKLRVCPKHGYWNLYQLLKTDAAISDITNWNYKIYSLLHQSQYSTCARSSDIKCLKQFVPRMKATADLCTNIPFKYNCLKAETQSCSNKILTDLLNVFPEEANKVLAVLCSQDSG